MTKICSAAMCILWKFINCTTAWNERSARIWRFHGIFNDRLGKLSEKWYTNHTYAYQTKEKKRDAF